MKVNENRVSELTGLKVNSLRAMRQRREGPAFYKLGRAVRYEEEEVLEWVASNRVETENGSREAESR